MFFKNKKNSKIDLEQHELLEHAQARIREKKRLFTHFVVFVVGSLLFALMNKILEYGATYDWFIWASLLWSFLFILHAVHVLFTSKFMGREWERAQREKLVQKQRQKIAEIQKEIETDFPLSNINKKE